jgi:glycosyltransferase involved in cell wall biosynthesis
MNSQSKKYRPVLVLAPGVLAGAEKVVLTGLTGLQEAGLNPLMVIIRETRVPHFAKVFHNALPSGTESIIIDSTKALDLHLPKRLKAALLNQSLPLVLHSHGFKALIACYMMKGQRPHIHTHHGDTGHTLKVRIYEKIAMLTMKTCNHVIAVSHKMKADLDQRLAPYKKITVIENMLSLSNAAKIRTERLNKDDHEKIALIFVGRLSPEKGLMNFLAALKLNAFKEKFHLTVLGDGSERNIVEKFLKDNRMNNLVTLHGFVSDPSSYFVKPDVLIMPSLREGLPMTLIESLASGVPVLANNVGAIASIVTHDHNGYFAKDLSLKSWDEALNVTVKNYRTWNKNAAQEAPSIDERFSLKHWTKKTQNLYEKEVTE